MLWSLVNGDDLGREENGLSFGKCMAAPTASEQLFETDFETEQPSSEICHLGNAIDERSIADGKLYFTGSEGLLEPLEILKRGVWRRAPSTPNDTKVASRGHGLLDLSRLTF